MKHFWRLNRVARIRQQAFRMSPEGTIVNISKQED